MIHLSLRRAAPLGVIFLLVMSAALGKFQAAPPLPESMDAASELVALRDSMQPVPGGEDAWPRYVAVFRDTLGVATFGDRDSTPLATAYWRVSRKEFAVLLGADLDDPAHDEAKRTLAELEPMLAAIRHATAAPNCRAPIFADSNISLSAARIPVEVADAEPGDLASYYSEPLRLISPMLMRLLVVDARVAAHAGDFTRAAEDYRQLFAIARHMAASPLYATQTARMEVAHLTGESFRASLLEFRWPAAAIDAVLAALPAAEWFDLADYFERTAAVHAHMDARHHARLLAETRGDLRNLPQLLMAPKPARVAEACEEHYRRQAAVVDARLSERSLGFGDDETVDAAQPAISTSTILARRRDRSKAGLAATRILLLLAKHHALTGEWPGALDEVMPLEDTLEPATGEPFVYARTPDGETPFTLRAPDAAAAFLGNEEDRDFTRPREPID